ncbi:MAG: 4Fe-4S binding protein [Actinobacteria bacterium]|nr:4Fe-4S binding protein [Actinomycetota bacterium]
MKLFKAPAEYVIQRKIPFMYKKVPFIKKVPFVNVDKVGQLLFDATGLAFGASRLPFVKEITPYFKKEKNYLKWLPVNEKVEIPENAPLPPELLDRCIEEASHRVIIEGGCFCRILNDCQHYPHDLGCLFMGDSALEVPESISREVTIEEAKTHARKGLEAGLVPLIGKVRIDNLGFSVKDRGKLLTVCFCCECCCISRYLHDMEAADLVPLWTGLEGITVEVTDDCTGCGVCRDACYTRAINIPYGKAQISDYCKACGRCVTACPNNAIKIHIDDPEFLDKTLDRIRAEVDYRA